MGGILTLPRTFISIVFALLDKGLLYCIYYAVSYIYLGIQRRIWCRRFDLYDFRAVEPEKTGFFVPHQEWKLDSPQDSITALLKNADDAFFFGVNSKWDGLAVHVARLCNGKVRCNLFLCLSDGRQYTLPEKHVYQLETTDSGTFGSSRLKLQCLLPMRKWRLFFNGILKLHSSGDDDDDDTHQRYHHVKFVFIFTASSGIFDFTSDMSKDLLAQQVSSSSSLLWKSLPFSVLHKISNIFNGYEQSGMMLGTVKVEKEEEKETHLWGSRGRYIGETRKLKNSKFLDIFGSFENGAVIHLGVLSLYGVSSRFPYGYIMKSDGFFQPLRHLAVQVKDQFKFEFICGLLHYQIDVQHTNCDSAKFEKEFHGTSSMRSIEITMNGIKGRGFIFNGLTEELSEAKLTFSIHKIGHHRSKVPLTISFDEVDCQNPELTGGKGSSLCKLYSMSKEKQKSMTTAYAVPKGIVVTTEAYKIFLSDKLEDSVQKFQKTVWSKPKDDIAELCQRMVQEISEAKLPETICDSILTDLKKIFGTELTVKQFAVRSSSVGEDTELLSAAGQLKTFLGLRDLSEILEAVKKCWASQFSVQAVKYKRQYGQLLNTPMAVVIQEMVSCEVSGVVFTCDPLSGNPSFINITANWGLGESIVSASAEPDTIILKRDVCHNVKFHNHLIGKKERKIILKSDSGTEEVEVTVDKSVCCLNQDLALALGKLAVVIEKKFGSSRDIEWGALNNEIFLFQSRPVTSLDIDTDFESKHFFDTYLRREDEYVTKANVGEVLPGATTPLGLDLHSMIASLTYPKQRYVRFDEGIPNVPFFHKGVIYTYNHAFLCLVGGFLRSDNVSSDMMKSMLVALCGRIITDEKLFQMAAERYSGSRSDQPLLISIYCLFMMFLSGIYVRKLSKKLEQFKFPSVSNCSAAEVLNHIACNLQFPAEILNSHMECSLSSSFWNMSILSFLAKVNGDWNNDVYTDFAYLLSTCTEVESADVPDAIQSLGCTIAKSNEAEKFRSCDAEEALKWLLNSNFDAGKQFRSFLVKHGHRCLKEFDVHSVPWGENPSPLIKILQNFVAGSGKEVVMKEVLPFSSVLSNMHVHLNLLPKLTLLFLLPNCRRAVREREYSKSLYIKVLNKLRQPFRHLGKVMVREGYLPNEELLYFLCIEELRQLIKTRSPRLVTRAFRRWKCHAELDKLIFPEIISGIPKPINAGDIDNVISGELIMIGIPISPGVVKAVARVIVHLEEASAIKFGDILITYSTDIGWSPYFPLLSGIVTELGGLISHGAVIAREYGLPCVVGLHGATQCFKSGDVVILDGNKGVLTRVKSS